MLCVLLTVFAVGLLVQHHQLRDIRTTVASRAPSVVDVGFSQAMTVHHQQAILMSNLMLDGRPTGLADMARKIANSQMIELGEMRGWLRLWDEPLAPPKNSEMVWIQLSGAPLDASLTRYLVECSESSNGMPGLATAEQLQQLRRLEGRARDELFLRLMLDHHEGGLPMAQFTARYAKLPVVKQLAQLITLDQSNEVGQFSSMLRIIAASKLEELQISDIHERIIP
jgi:uncharacterized protein (DUF305 family)